MSLLTLAWAGGNSSVRDCDKALVVDHYSLNESLNQDWHLASLVTEDVYNEKTQGANAQAVIYGIPVGGSWQDFQKNITKKQSQLNESYNLSQTRSVAWTGLDADAVTAYTDCLKVVANSKPGLYLIMNTLTAEDAAVYIRWNPGNYGPSTIQLDWAPANLFPGLPSSVTKSDTGAPYTFHRQQTIDQDVIARIKINGQIISGANIVIPAIVPKTVFTYSCAKLSATHDQCLRCDFEVTKLPPSVSWETHACNHMPVATPVSASFKGRVTQSKLPGQTCELVANFRGPDGKETTGINPAYQQSPEASCSWDVSFGPTDFKGATTDKTGLVEAADQLGSCMPPTYANCTMSGTLSIFVPDGADSN